MLGWLSWANFVLAILYVNKKKNNKSKKSKQKNNKTFFSGILCITGKSTVVAFSSLAATNRINKVCYCRPNRNVSIRNCMILYVGKL